MMFARSLILVFGFSGDLLAQGSGLVQPLSTPLPAPGVQAVDAPKHIVPAASPPPGKEPADASVPTSSSSAPPATSIAQPLSPTRTNSQGSSSPSLAAPVNPSVLPAQNDVPAANP